MSNKPYTFVEEEEREPVIWPRRVEILFEEWKKASKTMSKMAGGRNVRLDYTPETVDYHEKIFEDRVRLKPDSLKVTINQIYRVKDLKAQKEWYTYSATKTVNNALNQMAEPFSFERFGYHKRPVIKMQYNEAKEKQEPRVSGYEPCFELVWNKEEVTKLLQSSYFACDQFYVGAASIDPNDPIADRCYKIQNKEDFLNGSFEDLIDLGRLGISYNEPSIYLIPAARKKERENREASLGMREPRVYT